MSAAGISHQKIGLWAAVKAALTPGAAHSRYSWNNFPTHLKT